ncbi:MAG: ComEC/Rec2 family competence protein [Lachnospiraceae bacterium]|nr:ComEC/Rec2 family competence protein [Lachnospiraceae bacterium]
MLKKTDHIRWVKRTKQIVCFLLVLLLTAFCCGCGDVEIIISSGSDGDTVNSGEKSSTEDSTLEMHFLDVGQGDCTLIICDGHSMLIDAGKNDQGTEIQSYLESKGIEKLDYAIGTHPDSDHIGGLDVVLYKFGADQVFMPDYAKDTKTYDDVVQVIKNKNLKRSQPEVGSVWQLGGAEFTIVAPNRDYGSQANDYSIAILLTHGDKKFLLTGDAEEDSEADMLDNGIVLKADVYKAAHHGSKTASTEEFLEAVNPEYAVISVGEGNSYGHPHAEVLNRLRSMGVKVFRTDEQGTVVLKSDGKKITWNMSPSDSWKAGEPGSASQAADPDDKTGSKTETTAKETKSSSGKTTYYINTNTGKFHKPDCRYAPDQNADNCEITTLTKSALKKKGYDPCSYCVGD